MPTLRKRRNVDVEPNQETENQPSLGLENPETPAVEPAAETPSSTEEKNESAKVVVKKRKIVVKSDKF